ncbi:DUF4163 domain-containing protein [Novosphingobium sp. ZN18A2]|uniref:DUF4163 domain-containing protein n=1 Tax=Novosphingobium sp. ZN18A2 TaxID=3079861 RepID=UPI0030CBEF54
MRLPPAPVSALLSALLLAACSGGGSPDDAGGGAQAASSPAPATARTVKEANDLYSFAYSYPAQAGAIPALKTWLDADLDKAKSELANEAKDARDDAERQGYPFRPYDRTEHWKVVASLPGWLSLSGETYAFTGGAHGMTGFETLLWDKAADTRRKPIDLFVSEDALRGAIRKDFCAQLDKQRIERRQGHTIGGGISEFVQCIDPLRQTLVLGSSNGKTFDRIDILIAPYAAGPYAEGTYDVAVPVTDAVLRAVKPAWREYFANGG